MYTATLPYLLPRCWYARDEMGIVVRVFPAGTLIMKSNAKSYRVYRVCLPDGSVEHWKMVGHFGFSGAGSYVEEVTLEAENAAKSHT